MKFVAASIVLAATVSVALAHAAPLQIPYGYRLVPINNNMYYNYAAPIARYASPLPAPYLAAMTAPIAVAGQHKSESFSPIDGSRSEIRDDSGQVSLSYSTPEGMRVSERSYLKPGPEGYVPVKEGTYAYTSPEGTPVSFAYKADENGYVVSGYPHPSAAAPA